MDLELAEQMAELALILHTLQMRTSTSLTLALLIGSGDFWTMPSTKTMLSIAKPAVHFTICLLTFSGVTSNRA